ncbi:hypothetical protein ACVDFE_07800 [Lentzea chajnantorensis]
MRKIALLPAAVLALLGGCGSTADTGAAPASSASTTTTTTSAPTTTTTKTSERPQPERLFLIVMKDKGYAKTSLDETLLLTEADLHCRSLADGLTRQQILNAAGLPGSTARTRSEAVFFAAVASFCPEQSAKATS